MLKVTLKGIAAHRRRLLSTMLAVLFGVAFLAGTLMLTATINRTFDDLFADANAGVDAYVRNDTEIDTGFQVIRGLVDESLVETVAGVDGVVAAEGNVFGFGQAVAKDGEKIGEAMGAPTFAGNWSEIDELNPYEIVEGGPPVEADDAVIDRKIAKEGGYVVGDSVPVIAEGTPRTFQIVGIATFQGNDSSGGATFVGFTLDTAQEFVAQPGMLNGVAVVGDESLSQEDLVTRIEAALPDGSEAITGEQLTEENQSDIEEALQFFNIFLLVFAGIALVVAVFSIYNTFSIIIAQRTREMALLRAVGASRTQVLGSILVEAFAVGVVASALGFGGGFLVVGLLKGLLNGFGVDIPAGGIVVTSTAVIASFVVGIAVTMVAAVTPAIKASRVPPLAAMRDVAVDRTHVSVVRIVLGAVITGLGVLSLLSAVVSGGDQALATAGTGALLTIIGTVVLGPAVSRPVSRLLGWPLQRFRGVTGRLARENASRNPRRTSGTASALMIGVAVVCLFTVVASSIKASIDEQVSKSFAGDLVIDSETFGFGGLNPDLAARVNELDEVDAATGIRIGEARLDGKDRGLTVIDPATFPSIFDIEVADGSLEDMGPEQLGIAEDAADDNGWEVGTVVETVFPNGATTELTVAMIYARDEVVGRYVVSTEVWGPNSPTNLDAIVLVNLADGVSDEEGKAAIEPITADYANAKLQDRNEFIKAQAAQVNLLLGLVYVMLALAILIALMGIANTLALSIHERTREVGVLRAVGQTRQQLKSMVRWESVIVALFGTVGGMLIGVFFGWALVKAAADQGFSTFQMPYFSLVALTLLGAGAGVLAAWLPARRAAKLDILAAIAAQ